LRPARSARNSRRAPGGRAGQRRRAYGPRGDQQTHLGTTYVLSLRVRITKCRDGRRIVKAFHRCRKEHHHRNGICHHRVFNYRCTERRYNKSRLSYDSKVRCAKGSRRVWHTYTQNL
jgi:hypothetical protein